MKKIDRDTVREIGIWTLRVFLVLGAIVSGAIKETEVATGCIMGLVASFFFLD
jgi:hypothetical protein